MITLDTNFEVMFRYILVHGSALAEQGSMSNGIVRQL